MAETPAIAYTGARAGDALPSFLHRTIRVTYVPRSSFRVGLQPAVGLELQDAGARGFLSAMGTPAAGSSGALTLDWRVVSAANPSSTLGDAIAVLDDHAFRFGARVATVAIVGAAPVDRAAADRQAAAAGAAPRVPTLSGALAGAAGTVGDVLENALVWVVILAILALIGLYLVTQL